MAVSYTRVNWNTGMYINPENMNQMDKGIFDVASEVASMQSVFNAKKINVSGGTSTVPIDATGTESTTSGSFIKLNDAKTGNWIALGNSANHKLTGVYSSGYSEDGITKVDSGEWIIYRGSDGTVYLPDQARVSGVFKARNIELSPSSGDGLLVTGPTGGAANMVAKDGKHGGRLVFAWDSTHKTHGISSSGFSTDGTTLTASPMWLLWRGEDGTVHIPAHRSSVEYEGLTLASADRWTVSTPNTNNVTRCGQFISIDFNTYVTGAAKTSGNGFVTLGTLSENFRPSHNVLHSFATQSNGYVFVIQITSDGKVNLFCSTTSALSGDYIRQVITFVTSK